MTPLIKPGKKWNSVDDFLVLLQEKNIKAELGDFDKKNWDSLLLPASIEQAPKKTSFTYFSKQNSSIDFNGWGLVFVGMENKKTANNVIAVSHPEAAMHIILQELSPAKWHGDNNSYSNLICEANVHVGPDCIFGEHIKIQANARIGARVKIGSNSFIGAGVIIEDDCQIGENCIIGANTSIGGQGFGLINFPGSSFVQQRIHVGTVVIGNNVRIGSNVCIDKGVFENTTICNNVSIDNLVQVGHNCVIGDGSVLCSFVGLSGSTKIGVGVTMAGQSVSAGHLTIGDGSTVAGASSVTKNIPPKSVVKGHPARPIKEYQKSMATLARLPVLIKKLSEKKL